MKKKNLSNLEKGSRYTITPVDVDITRVSLVAFHSPSPSFLKGSQGINLPGISIKRQVKSIKRRKKVESNTHHCIKGAMPGAGGSSQSNYTPKLGRTGLKMQIELSGDNLR